MAWTDPPTRRKRPPSLRAVSATARPALPGARVRPGGMAPRYSRRKVTIDSESPFSTLTVSHSREVPGIRSITA